MDTLYWEIFGLGLCITFLLYSSYNKKKHINTYNPNPIYPTNFNYDKIKEYFIDNKKQNNNIIHRNHLSYLIDNFSIEIIKECLTKSVKKISSQDNEVITLLLLHKFCNIELGYLSNQEFKDLLKTIMHFGFSPEGRYPEYNDYSIEIYSKTNLVNTLITYLSCHNGHQKLEKAFFDLLAEGFFDIYLNKNKHITQILQGKNEIFASTLIRKYPIELIHHYKLTTANPILPFEHLIEECFNHNNIKESLPPTNKTKRITI